MASATRSKKSLDAADMNNQHLIDNAFFDTTYSGMDAAFERRMEFDNFVKTSLLNVIDEVFDKIDSDCGNPDSVFRIDKLEINLGNIPYRDYRQQMPGKLREQLLTALREVRYSATKKTLPGSSLVEGKIAAQAQLFYFLRNGYLPWYSRLTDASAVESLLVEAIDSAPATLIEFMRDNVQPARVLERLVKQFSKPTVQRVMELLSLSATPENGRAAYPVKLEAQLVSALLAGDAALIEPAWQALYGEHSQLLNKILRHYGQQASVRQNIASSFSPARFNELLRLLEPDAHGFVQMVLDHAELFQPVDDQSAAGRSRQSAELRTFTLYHLLAERGGRFSNKSYLRSLLRQMSVSKSRTQSLLLARLIENTGKPIKSNKLAGDMLRLLGEVAAEMAEQMTSNKDSSSSEVSARNVSNKDLPLTEVTSRLASRKDSPSSDVTARMVSNKDSPLTEGTSRLASRKDSPSSEVTAGMASNKDSSLSEVSAQVAGYNDSLSSKTENQAGPHEQYQRLMSALTIAGAGRAYRDSLLLEDIKILTRDAPYLLTRLFRELHTGGHSWRQAIETLSTPVLAELGYAFVTSNKQYDEAVSSDPGSDLLSAIHRNAEKSQDKRAFFIHILICLINDEPIDFNAIRSDPSFKVKPAATPGDQAHSVNKAEHPLDTPPGQVRNAAIDASGPDQEESGEPAPLENIYIANAGAVLLAPYLPRLFERLGLVDQGKFKNREAAEYGVHCVQFLVNESISSPEYQLVLNKLLCGVKPGLPIRRSIELAAADKEQLEALLHAVTRHWKPLANTSIAGLRESFLQRNGSLQLKRDAWHLSVEARSFDMLLDQIPWSFSTIKFPWMDRVIYVEWR